MAQLGLGTTLKIGEQLVGGLNNIEQIEQTIGKVDVSTLTDTHRKNMPGGLKDTSDLSVEGNYTKGDVGQKAMATAFKNKVISDFVITYPAGETLTFKGFITKLVMVGKATKEDETLSFSATIAFASEPVFTEAV